MSPKDLVAEDGGMSNAEELRAKTRAAMKERGLTQKEAAAQIGNYGAATLNQWLKGVYEGDNTKVDAAVARWLESMEAKRAVAARRLDEPGFQRTETAEDIWALLAQAQHGPDIVICAGAPGIGKTTTALAYQAKAPNVWVVTLDPEQSAPHAFLAELSEALGIPMKNPLGLRRAVGERVQRTGGLIVVDEAQHLSHRALDMIRSLHDRYDIGVALLGNYGLYAGTTAASTRDGFAQFFSRVGARRRIAAPRPRDIEVMLDAWGIEASEHRKFLRSIAGKAWALRGLKKTLGVASAIAAGADEELGLSHMKAAWAQLNHFEG